MFKKYNNVVDVKKISDKKNILKLLDSNEKYD